MMRNIKEKSLVFGTIALFVCAIILPIVSGNVPKSKNIFHEEKESYKTNNLNQWPPWVLTLPATNIDPWGKHATLNGILMSRGGTKSCEVWFVWDTKFHFYFSDYAHATAHKIMNFIGSFSKTITGLKRGTTYHFRAVAYNGYFYDQGWDLGFIPGLPSVTTMAASEIGTTSATLNGRLDDMGGADKCNVWFVWDTISHHYYGDYNYSTRHQSMDSTSLFSKKITGLKQGTTYYFRAVASNDVGTTYGEEKNFTTRWEENNPPNPPSRPSGRVWGKSNIQYSYFTSTIDPDGDKIKFYFDWGDGNGNWTDYVNSGETASASHSWKKAGTYKIKAKAKDEYGAESGWSPSLNLTIEDIPPNIEINKPKNGFYISDRKIIPLPCTLIIGDITIQANVSDEESGVAGVEFYIDGILKFNDSSEPYEWLWDETAFFRYIIKVVAYDNAGNKASDEIKIWKFF